MKCKDCNYNCARRGEGETECFYEIEMRNQKEAEEASYWQSFRAEAAKDILSNALIPYALKEFSEETINIEYWTDRAVEWTDALVKKLKEKEEK